MKHKKTHLNAFLAAPAVLFLLVGGCDSGNGEPPSEPAADSGAAISEATEPGVDYSTTVKAEQVKSGVAFGEITIGSPDAPATMIEYASLTCPHCANFHKTVFPEIVEKYVKPGRLKIVFRNFILNRADLAVSMLSRCFGEERTVGLMTYYFERQRQWAMQDALPEIINLARQAGISRTDFDACLANTDLQKNLIEMTSRGSDEDGVNGTPTFLIGNERIVGEAPFAAFEELINDIL